MHTTSLEVSKRLFEVSGWKGSQYKHCHTDKVGHFILRLDHPNWKPEFYVTEAYDSGYLLRKLPDTPAKGLFWRQGKWNAEFVDINDDINDKYKLYTSHSDTPEDALALLAISLFEEGVLK